MLNIIHNKNTDAYFNLACEEYFLKNKNDEIFMLWQNASAIIVGYHQNTISEIDYEFVRKNNIKVVRRLTGGGAVYHDLGNVNFTFIENIDSAQAKTASFQKYIQTIIKILNTFGIDAKFEGRNDITIDAKKISGNSEIIFENRIMHHGTLLFNSNLDVLISSLNSNPYKYADKGVKSIKSRVTNIMEHIQVPINVDTFMSKILNEIANLNPNSIKYDLSSEDTKHIQQLRDSKYLTSEWNYGQSPKYNFHKVTKIPSGVYQIYLTIKLNQIESIKIYGDFFSIADISNIENKLIGVEYNKDSVEKALLDMDFSEYFVNTTLYDFITCLF